MARVSGRGEQKLQSSGTVLRVWVLNRTLERASGDAQGRLLIEVRVILVVVQFFPVAVGRIIHRSGAGQCLHSCARFALVSLVRRCQTRRTLSSHEGRRMCLFSGHNTLSLEGSMKGGVGGAMAGCISRKQGLIRGGATTGEVKVQFSKSKVNMDLVAVMAETCSSLGPGCSFFQLPSGPRGMSTR